MAESPFLEVPSGIALAHYFWEETDRQNRGCDGINLWRDGRDYCYLWVEATVDHDMWMSYLLDVRTAIGDEKFSETRDFLFLHVGAGDVFEVEWHNQPIRFDAPIDEHHDRHYNGLRWFVERVTCAVEERAR